MNVVTQQDFGPIVPHDVQPAPPPLPTPSPTPSRKSSQRGFKRLAAIQAAIIAQLRAWFVDDGCWYVSSMFAHAFVLFGLAMITMVIPRSSLTLTDSSPIFETPEMPSGVLPELKRFEIGDASEDPSVLDIEMLLHPEPEPVGGQTAKYFDDSPEFEDAGGGTVTDRQGQQLGGLGGFDIKNLAGPGGKGGVGVGAGTGTSAGIGGSASGFGFRGKGHRDALLGAGGGTKASERAVLGALDWLRRHQGQRGNWSLDYRHRCKGGLCSGPGDDQLKSDSAATGLALLPFLACGQTHKSKGPCQTHVNKGILWLIKQQDAEGDLSGKCFQPMYAHAIATLALCEAYGMTRDPNLAAAAQKAVGYIERAQNEGTGGWRYVPQEAGDTSVFGWQIMALKSAQLAGLSVNSMVLENAQKWLHSVAKGEHLGLYSYQPYGEVRLTMTAVGMLCTQYLGVGRNDPPMLEGMHKLMENLPDNTLNRNTYYWYYATLAMHNFGGPEWDAWNRKMRRVLVNSQIKEGCASGSWDPAQPTVDPWGIRGGRLMMTTFNALTLEVYYRFLPLFNTDSLVPVSNPAVKAAQEANAESSE